MRERLNKWVSEAVSNPWRAPWSGQRVGKDVRAGAVFLSACFLFVVIDVLLQYIAGDNPLDLSIKNIVVTVLYGYVATIFLRVALTGHSPKGWIPWR